MIGFSLVFSLYLQIGLGYSPLKTGLAGAPQAARHDRRLHRGQRRASARSSVAGCCTSACAVMAAGAGVVRGDPARRRSAGASPWQLAPALAVVGFGMGLLMAPFFDLDPGRRRAARDRVGRRHAQRGPAARRRARHRDPGHGVLPHPEGSARTARCPARSSTACLDTVDRDRPAGRRVPGRLPAA